MEHRFLNVNYCKKEQSIHNNISFILMTVSECTKLKHNWND